MTKLAPVSYIYPDTVLWPRIIKAKPAFVILNPDSGPKEFRDPGYATLFLKLLENQITTLGYLATGYAKKPLWQVENERRLYEDQYGPFGGWFFDEVHDKTSRLPYYKALCRDGEKNVLNPGAFCDQAYAGTGAILCPYETDFATYQARAPMEWMKQCPTWHIVHSVPDAAAMRVVVALAERRGAAYLWACSDPAKYNVLPSWFDEMAGLLNG